MSAKQVEEEEVTSFPSEKSISGALSKNIYQQSYLLFWLTKFEIHMVLRKYPANSNGAAK